MKKNTVNKYVMHGLKLGITTCIHIFVNSYDCRGHVIMCTDLWHAQTEGKILFSNLLCQALQSCDSYLRLHSKCGH